MRKLTLSSLVVLAGATFGQSALATGSGSFNQSNDDGCSLRNVGDTQYDSRTDTFKICLLTGNWLNVPASAIRGPEGDKGDKGDRGLTGLTGAVGPMGPAGPAGAAGAKGAAGAVGPMGPAGAQGLQGLTGAVGPAGPAGAKGATGDKGATGAQGPAGLMGPQGPAGAAGAAGAQGLQGIQGMTGPRGADGAPGPQGLPGLNALQVKPVIWSGGCNRHGGVDPSFDQTEWYCLSDVKFNSAPEYFQQTSDGIGLSVLIPGYYRIRFWSLAKSTGYDFIYAYIVVGGVRQAATEEYIGDQQFHHYQMDVVVPVLPGQPIGINIPAAATQRWYNDIEGWSGLQVSFVGPLN